VALHGLPLRVKLMPHQQAMVYRMLQLEKSLISKPNAYAMMSDKPGAGKTYAILAMLYITNKLIFKNMQPHVNLIVVPYNICTQWKESMEKIYGLTGETMKYKVLTEYADMMSLYVEPEKLMQYDVLLTTSLYFDSLASTLMSLKLKIQRVFFDEADTIKNLLGTPLMCNMTWFVSASMESLFIGKGGGQVVNVGNYNLDMQRLMQNNVHCEPDFINENIVLEEPIIHDVKCQNVYRDLLLQLVANNHHEAVNAMDFRFLRSDFITLNEFNGIIDTNHKGCGFIYMDAIASEKNSRDQLPSLERDYKFMVSRGMNEKALNIKKQIEKHMENISISKSKQEIVERFKIHHGMDSEQLEGNAKPNDSKLDIIKNIMANKLNKDEQAIIFTNHDGIYAFIRPFLREMNIKYRDLDGGNITSMDSIIGAYKRGEFRVLLADSSMYSCGMNLENTNTIIFLHKMDEQREKQVIGRAHRYGRTAPLNIWYIDYIG
jgi:SNF2 family DNA or RNA helicase